MQPESEPAVPAPEGREGFTFTPPRRKAVLEHVAALRANPDSADRPCWPSDLARTVPPSAALAPGARPVLVIFFDDGARASRLFAADVWPVVLDLEDRADLVLVDLTPGRRLPDDARRLVRKYYLGYVPTTVVLSSSRTIRLLKSERVDPEVVRAALLEAR